MKIVFDGNIGCGKSKLINTLSSCGSFSVPVYNEPLNDWKDWLELFYSDMNKYAFGFQMRVLKSHLDKKTIQSGIFERSPLSCQQVFGKLLYEDKMMNELEWNLTNEFNSQFGWLPDIVFYLRCSPEICHQRINQRNRNGEESISLEYLEKVHQKYEELYDKNIYGIKIITIDATQTPTKVFDTVTENLIRKTNYY
jgi:deoxyadenosine/deoxycytidine kinase